VKEKGAREVALCHMLSLKKTDCACFTRFSAINDPCKSGRMSNQDELFIYHLAQCRREVGYGTDHGVIDDH